MKATQSRQKSYHDKRKKDLEFQEGDHVFLKVTPVTGVGCALKLRMLTHGFIGHIRYPGELDLLLIEWCCHQICQIYMMCSMFHNYGSMF